MIENEAGTPDLSGVPASSFDDNAVLRLARSR
jgi:hypothetical protein